MCSLTETLNRGWLFLILLLLEKSSAADYWYDACAPRTCGKLNISFPFYIQGVQEQFCGQADFGINCSNPSSPIIHVPENDYVIDDIFYQDQTLRVHNAAVSNINNCLPQIGNITEHGSFSVTENSSLRLLSNCIKTLPGVLQKYRKDLCHTENDEGWGLAMLGDDQNLNIAFEVCTRNVLVPVEGEGNDGDNGVVDYNELLRRGFVFNWIAYDCSKCERSGGRCGFNTTSVRSMCFCPDRPHFTRCVPRKKKLGISIGIGAAAVGMGLLASFLTCFYKIMKSSDAPMLILRMKGRKDSNLESFVRQFGSLAPKWYLYSDIKKMTNSFKDKLGQGGYGTVYRGKLPDDHLVAVKILNVANGNDEDFINEVLSISKTSHINVVKLLGFCVQGRRRALVYEYMPNGSLDKYVHAQKNSNTYGQLGMDKLYQISLGVARGLEYLHRGCNTRILHFDIKPHNILLDEDFCPKISDFGLAKQCANKDSAVSLLGVRGTIGYIAPEQISRLFGVVSYKSDVYSYGMMILEIVGRRKNVCVQTSNASEIYFPHWAYQHLVVNKDLRMKGIVTLEEDEIAKKIILVGLWCIQTDPSNRPTMSKVIEMLEGCSQAIEFPPKPFFGSPATSPEASFNSISETSALLTS